MSSTYDVVDHPNHYHRDGVNFECVELSALLPHPIASAVEYVWRHRQKHGIEDLRKAAWWLEYARRNVWTVHDNHITNRYKYIAAEYVDVLWQRTKNTPEGRFWAALYDYLDDLGMSDEISMAQTIDSMTAAVRDMIEQEQS